MSQPFVFSVGVKKKNPKTKLFYTVALLFSHLRHIIIFDCIRYWNLRKREAVEIDFYTFFIHKTVQSQINSTDFLKNIGKNTMAIKRAIAVTNTRKEKRHSVHFGGKSFYMWVCRPLFSTFSFSSTGKNFNHLFVTNISKNEQGKKLISKAVILE